MSIGLIGRKVGMTQIFAEDGNIVPVSVVAIEPNTVTMLRTLERDGYTAVQLGTGTARKTNLGPPTADALPALQARLAELYGIDPDRVLVTVGASGAMAICALRYFRPGVAPASPTHAVRRAGRPNSRPRPVAS